MSTVGHIHLQRPNAQQREAPKTQTFKFEVLNPNRPRIILNLLDLPVPILARILAFYTSPSPVVSTLKNQNQNHTAADTGNPTTVRLVNRLLAALALPHILHTLRICCPKALVRLLAPGSQAGTTPSTCYSPLFRAEWVGHVKCVEVLFDLSKYCVRGSPSTSGAGAGVLPVKKLLKMHEGSIPVDVVKFCFSSGATFARAACAFGDDEEENVDVVATAEDTLDNPAVRSVNSTCLAFLLLFNPRRFEWVQTGSGFVSGSGSGMRLVGITPTLRALFLSWSQTEPLNPTQKVAKARSTRLTYISLDSTTLIDHLNLFGPISWVLFLPAETVCIRGPRALLEALILQGRITGKSSEGCTCTHVKLEAIHYRGTADANAHAVEKERERKREVGVVLYGNTLVSIKGWSTEEYQRFKARLRLLHTTTTATANANANTGPPPPQASLPHNANHNRSDYSATASRSGSGSSSSASYPSMMKPSSSALSLPGSTASESWFINTFVRVLLLYMFTSLAWIVKPFVKPFVPERWVAYFERRVGIATGTGTVGSGKTGARNGNGNSNNV